MRIAYFDCYSGISGDMTLAAFLDAGLNFETLKKELGKLKLKGYSLKKTKVMRGAIAATKFDCITSTHSHNHRSLKEILSIIDKSVLTLRVKDMAKRIFINIGDAEARIHGIRDRSEIRLHELGDTDSIIDIVGTAIAIDELAIDEIYASSVNTGRAFVDTKHGALPVPAPAALELLRGIPTEISGIRSELVTPTGAGILKTLVKKFGRMPEMEIGRIGYGAGSKELEEIPNTLRVIIGQASESFKEDRVYVVEANIDDMSPQNFEYLFEKLFLAGALDAYTTNIQMKKSRPAIKITAIAEHERLKDVCKAIFKETTTIGLRFYEVNRFKLDRQSVMADTRYGRISVKISKGPDNIWTASPEYEECVKIARSKKVPLKAVFDEARQAVKI